MSTHEDFTRKEEIRGPSDRSFGVVFAVVFALLGVWPVFSGRPVRSWAIGVGLAFIVLALGKPALLRPANCVWMKFGLLLGRVVNPVVTALLFYTVFTPMGILMRLLGKDLLRLGYEPEASSYWIERRPPGPKPETMSQQF